MEILDLRHFSSADLRPLLEDEIAMWGRLLSWDYTTYLNIIFIAGQEMRSGSGP